MAVEMILRETHLRIHRLRVTRRQSCGSIQESMSRISEKRDLVCLFLSCGAEKLLNLDWAAKQAVIAPDSDPPPRRER
jgi:hypothetical protein